MSHVAAHRFVEYLREPVSTGVLAALARIPAHQVPVVTLGSDSPWVMVDVVPGPSYAVWRWSGAVYQVNEDGSVPDDPILR